MVFDYKWPKSQIFLSFLMVMLSLLVKNIEAARDRGARCEKPDFIPNGSYRIRRDRVMRINCNPGFVLQGSKTIDCIRGKWDGEKPVCAKKGCKKDLPQPENGRIQIENDMKAILYCSDSYNLAGNRHSYCNGTHWDRPIGNCREQKNVVQHECDFETDDICGWTYEPREGLEWKRVMAANVFTTFKTGPRHDHTTLTPNGGHYMLMESLTKLNSDVTLTSPIYDRGICSKTTCCFQFYYFMYGAGVGDLLVVVKPVSLDLDDLLQNHKDLIKFSKSGNQNNIWNEAFFNIKEFEEDFQIIFVARSGRGQLSDIAIDDIKLLRGDDCKALNSKYEEKSSNEEYDTTTYESIFEIQSCVGHCFESPGNGLIRTLGHLKGLCNCDLDCEDNDSCCPDFKAVCLNELFAQSTMISEVDEATQKNKAQKMFNASTSPRTTSTTKKTIPQNTTTIKTTPSTTITTARTKLYPITVKTTPTTVKTTTTAATTTTTSTTTKPVIIVTPKTSTTRLITHNTTTTRTTTTTQKTFLTTKRNTTPTTTTRRTTVTTTPITTPTTTTTRKTTLATTGKTTPTTHKTTLATTRLTTPTTTTNKISTTPAAIKNTTTTTTRPTTLHHSKVTASNAADETLKQTTIPPSKPIDYIINDKSTIDAQNKGHSKILLFIFFIIVIVILAGTAYKRFGDKAVAWYMIRFNQSTSGDEDSSSVTTSFKRPQAKAGSANGHATSAWRNKFKRPANTKNTMKTPLVEDDDDDDYDIGANGNIALKNNIYTEL